MLIFTTLLGFSVCFFILGENRDVAIHFLKKYSRVIYLHINICWEKQKNKDSSVREVLKKLENSILEKNMKKAQDFIDTLKCQIDTLTPEQLRVYDKYKRQLYDYNVQLNSNTNDSYSKAKNLVWNIDVHLRKGEITKAKKICDEIQQYYHGYLGENEEKYKELLDKMYDQQDVVKERDNLRKKCQIMEQQLQSYRKAGDQNSTSKEQTCLIFADIYRSGGTKAMDKAASKIVHCLNQIESPHFDEQCIENIQNIIFENFAVIRDTYLEGIENEYKLNSTTIS